MKYIDSGLSKKVEELNMNIDTNLINGIEDIFNKDGINKVESDNLQVCSYKGRIVDNQLLVLANDKGCVFGYLNAHRKSCDKLDLTNKDAKLIKESIECDNYLESNITYKYNKALIRSYMIYHNILLNSIRDKKEMSLTLKDFLGEKIYTKFSKKQKKNSSR